MNYHDDSTVKLDWDHKRRPSLRRMVRLCDRAGYRLVAFAERRSPGGEGWHCWLVLSPRPATMVEVVALQAILGSDPWREAVTLYRAKRANTKQLRRMVNVLYAPCAERRKGVTWQQMMRE